MHIAANIGVMDRLDEETGEREGGRVVVAEDTTADTTAAFGEGGWDTEAVHAVDAASLRNESAEVMSAEEILEVLI